MKKNEIIISVSVVLALLTLILVFSFRQKGFIEGETDTLPLSEDMILELYKQVNPSEDATVLTKLYKEPNLDNGYILATALKAATPKDLNVNLPLDTTLPTIKQEEVENIIKKIFGNISYYHETTYILSDGLCGYSYKENLKIYELIPGCGGNSNESFYRQIKETKQIENKLLIYEQSVYMYNDWDSMLSRKYIYNNCEQQKLLDYVETNSQEANSINLESYIEGGSVYEYIFEKMEDRYIFKGIRFVE